MTFKRLIISLFIIFATGLISLSYFLTHKHSPVIHANAALPDAYMEDVVATIMNKSGKPTLKIETPRMIHFANNNTTDITKPHITVYRDSPVPWYINSDYAKATNGIDQIILWSNVVMNHPSDTTNPLTTMKTHSLTIFPDKKIAQTPDAVTITQPDMTVHAVGMFANFQDGTVKLLSQTVGEYAPTS